MKESKIGVCAHNKLLVTFDGQIGSFTLGAGQTERPLLGLCQLNRKAGPACHENLLTDEDFPDVRSEDTPCVFFYFETAKSIDMFIKMLESFKEDYLNQKQEEV